MRTRFGRTAVQHQRKVQSGRDQEGHAAAVERTLLHSQQQDPPSRYEGGKRVDHSTRRPEVGRFRFGPSVQCDQGGHCQSIYEPGGHSVVSSARTVAGRTELRAAGRHVGSRMHHGRDVDAFAHHAGEHREAADHPHFTAVRILHAGSVAGRRKAGIVYENGTPNGTQTEGQRSP